MITNVSHLIIYSIFINLISLGYISAVFAKTLAHDKNSSVALYATDHNEKIGETYTKIMFGFNITFVIGSIIFLLYVYKIDFSDMNNRIGWKGSIPFIIISLLYIILSALWIEEDMSSSQLINDQFLIYIIIGSIQFLLCIWFLYSEYEEIHKSDKAQLFKKLKD